MEGPPSDEGTDLSQVLFRVCDVLDDAGIPYLLTGAFVRNLVGESRTSLDVDLVIHPDHADPDPLAEAFRQEGFDVRGLRKSDMGERLVVDFHGDLSADLWLPSGHPLHHEEFDRAIEGEYKGRTLTFLHPEDFVLRKLVNYYKIRRNTNDLDDAYQVLLYAWDLVDVDELLERAVTHRVRDEAEELVATVREDRAELEEAGGD